MTTKPVLDPRLYLVIDPACCRHDPLTVAAAAARGGVTLVQLRDKHASTRALIRQAQALRDVLEPLGVPLLINDRVDVALAAAAAGVHVGQEDMPVEQARALLGPQAIIGLTVRSLEEAAAAPLDLLDYVSIGGVYATASKNNPNPPIGLDGLRQIAAAVRARQALPLTAISGLNTANSAAVMACGVDGVAVISAICAADDPEQAAAELYRLTGKTL